MQFKIFMANHHPNDPTEAKARIPVVEEVLHVGKREIETGSGVRLNKTVSEEVWRIDDTLSRQTLDIEHIPVNAWIAGEPPVQRYEGKTLVVPVLEEVLVVEKRLRLVEEIRITARSTQQPVSERVVLRKEQVSVEHFDEALRRPADDDASAGHAPGSNTPTPLNPID